MINKLLALINALLKNPIILILTMVAGLLFVLPLLNFQYFGNVQYNDVAYQWNGVTWTYPATYTGDFGGGVQSFTGMKPSTHADGTLKIVKENRQQEYVEYFKSEDISSFSQINLTIKKDMQAAMQANGETRAHYRLLFDGQAIDDLAVWGHCDGGGCIPANEIKTDTKNFLFKRDKSGWKVYTAAQTLIAESPKQNPQILFNLFGNLRGDGFSTTELIITGTTQKNNVLSIAPSLLNPPSLSIFFAQIRDWISKILEAIPFLAITGSTTPSLGTTQTYNIDLTAPYQLDDVYADGSFAVRYCDVALVKSDGSILAEKGWVTCSNTYTDTFTVTIPKTAGKYAVIGVMTESKATYNADTVQWEYVPYEIVSKDALDITTKAPIPGASSVPLPSSSNVFSKIFSWLFNLFR